MALLPVQFAPLLAGDGGEPLQGVLALDPGQMGKYRSTRFEPKWQGVFIAEPKPSQVGETALPQFGGDTARPFDPSAGASGRPPFSRLSAPVIETR